MAKYSLLLGAISATFLLTSCAPLPHDPKETYILVAANTKIPYWQTALTGLNRAAAEMKVKAGMFGPATYDLNAERDELRRAIQQKPSGIMISVADAKLLTPDINSALEQGIPVITVDADAPDSKRLFFVGTDNYNAGRLGGELLVKLLNGKGNVVVFTYPNQTNLTERLHGYEGVLTGYPGVKVNHAVDIREIRL